MTRESNSPISTVIYLWLWEPPEEAEEDLAFYASSSYIPWLSAAC